MKKILVFILFQIFFLSTLLPATDQKSFYDKYTNSLNSWINAEISLNQILKILSDLNADLDEQPLDWQTYYWKSRISFLRGQIYYEQKEKKLSINELEDCLYFARTANEIKENSESLSTMAMANSLLMLQKGLLFTIANFSIPKEQAEQAIKLNPKNSHALLIQAQFLCNTPAFAGGNMETGIKMLTALSERTDLNTADQFYVLQNLAEVYRDNNQKNDAAIICRQALTIFPGNKKCKEILSKLEQ